MGGGYRSGVTMWDLETLRLLNQKRELELQRQREQRAAERPKKK
jgi:hypothetical protein